jgi:uncharacterized phage-associated protein
MPVPYAPIAIANSFIKEFGSRSGIEHMKLQKLVYFSYGWWLAAHGMNSQRLTNEGPEIWKHGPVFDSLYQILKVFGRTTISEVQSDNPFADPLSVDGSDFEVNALISWVWKRYGHLSSFALSDMTHAEGTAWKRVAVERNFSVPYHTNIPDDYIFGEFSAMMKSHSSVIAGQRERVAS